MWTGCSQPSNTRTDELEGTPPPPSEDPFFFVAIPADAIAADTQGTIGAPTKPAEAAKPNGLPSQTPRFACFSCVQICLVDDDQTQCGDREDTICGWGVHASRDTASNLAQVECDGALDIARESVRFARIEGSCPIATCEAQ